VLVRFPRKDILDMVEKIEPAAVVNSLVANAVREKLIDQSAERASKDDLLEGVLAARKYALDGIEAALMGN
jgi:hypothetical protein